MMASGATKNVVRAAGCPRVCTGSDSSPRRPRNRTMTMASMPQTNTNTGSASQRMMYQSPCTSCAFTSSPGFTRPQPDVTSSSASSSSARCSTRRGPLRGTGPWPSSPGPGRLAPGPGIVLSGVISGSRGGERRDHADGDVRRAGATAGLAGLPAGRHVVPGREVHGDRVAGVSGQRVTAVSEVDPVVLGIGAVLLGVVDHVLGRLAGRQLQHHELVVDLERLLVGERDHDRLVRRHGRRHAVVGEVLHKDVVDGYPGSRRRRGRCRARAGCRSAAALGAADGDDEDRASRNGHDGNGMQIPTDAPCMWAGPAWRSHGCSFAPRFQSAPASTPTAVPWCRADKRVALTEMSIHLNGSVCRLTEVSIVHRRYMKPSWPNMKVV